MKALRIFAIIPVLITGILISALVRDTIGYGQFIALAVTLWLVIWIWRRPPPVRRSFPLYYLADADDVEQLDCYTHQQIVAMKNRDLMIRKENEEDFCPVHSHPDFVSAIDGWAMVKAGDVADQNVAVREIIEEVGKPQRASRRETVGRSLSVTVSRGFSQRLAMCIGLAIMCVAGFFPPKHSQREHLGQRVEVGRKAFWVTNDGDLVIETDFNRLFTEWATIAFGTGAAFFAAGLFRGKTSAPDIQIS